MRLLHDPVQEPEILQEKLEKARSLRIKKFRINEMMIEKLKHLNTDTLLRWVPDLWNGTLALATDRWSRPAPGPRARVPPQTPKYRPLRTWGFLISSAEQDLRRATTSPAQENPKPKLYNLVPDPSAASRSGTIQLQSPEGTRRPGHEYSPPPLSHSARWASASIPIRSCWLASCSCHGVPQAGWESKPLRQSRPSSRHLPGPCPLPPHSSWKSSEDPKMKPWICIYPSYKFARSIWSLAQLRGFRLGCDGMAWVVSRSCPRVSSPSWRARNEMPERKNTRAIPSPAKEKRIPPRQSTRVSRNRRLHLQPKSGSSRCCKLKFYLWSRQAASRSEEEKISSEEDQFERFGKQTVFRRRKLPREGTNPSNPSANGAKTAAMKKRGRRRTWNPAEVAE